MKTNLLIMAGAGLAALAGAAALAQPRPGGNGTATYWMSAETSSGLAAMAGASPTSMVGALIGRGRGGDGFVRNLQLQLSSSGRPAGAPSAEHLPPPGLQAGATLPLLTPQAVRAPAPTGPWQGNMERPRGRMLIYWGCGEHARPGQPVIIDFATLTSGRAPPAFANSSIRPMVPPSPATGATYGEWPNQRSQTRVPAGGSLVGPHVVRGNYSPEIRFALAPGQDFLAPVVLTANSAAASGSVPLIWRPVPGARAWLAAVMGAAANGDFVMWSSSEIQTAMMAMDYLPEGEIARLVQQRMLLPAAADRCTVPAEVARAAPQSMLSLTAFGGEANFSNPVRPARAPASWKPEWTVKLRTKSTHMSMLGMSMEQMMGGQGDQPRPPETRGSKARRKLGKILGQ